MPNYNLYSLTISNSIKNKKMDDLDQKQTCLRVHPGHQGTTQEKMDASELLLHTDSDGAWIIPSQAADVWISGQCRL